MENQQKKEMQHLITLLRDRLEIGIDVAQKEQVEQANAAAEAAAPADPCPRISCKKLSDVLKSAL